MYCTEGNLMGYSARYGKVTTEKGDIPEEEPVFLFRAQDKTLPTILSRYYQMCREMGTTAEHLEALDKVIHDIVDWQSKNFTEVPTHL